MNSCRKTRTYEAERVLEQYGEMSRKIMVPQFLNARVLQNLPKTQSPNNKKRRVAVILAIALLGGTLTAVAAVRHYYSRGFEKQMALTESEKETAEEEGIVHFPENEKEESFVTSITEKGITVTVQQTVADAYSAWISFRVEGYDAGSSSPEFERVELLVDGMSVGERKVNYGWSFFDENDYEAYYPDEAGNIVRRSKLADGSYELLMQLSWNEEEGSLPGRIIEVTFNDLSTAENEITEKIQGKWSLRWKLEGSSETIKRIYDLPMGQTGAIIKAVELSPLSAIIEIEWPYQENTTGSLDKALPPPQFAGIQMKDGRILTEEKGNLLAENSSKFEKLTDSNTAVFTEKAVFTRIIDSNSVTALLFENPEYQGVLISGGNTSAYIPVGFD